MRMNRFFQDQYENCTVERPPSIQGDTADVIATGIKMLIDPVRSFQDPQDANVRPQLATFLADVLDRTHTGVADIRKFDVVRTDAGREFLVVTPLDAVGTDVLQFELEARDV